MQQRILDDAPEGMLTCRTGQSGSLVWGIAILIAVITIAVVTSAIFQ